MKTHATDLPRSVGDSNHRRSLFAVDSRNDDILVDLHHHDRTSPHVDNGSCDHDHSRCNDHGW